MCSKVNLSLILASMSVLETNLLFTMVTTGQGFWRRLLCDHNGAAVGKIRRCLISFQWS
jgi:hypothetical protein